MDELTAMIFMTVTIFAGVLLLDWACDVDDRASSDANTPKK